MLPYKYHALKLTVLRTELDELPRMYLGRDLIYFEKEDGSFSKYRKTSKKGKILYPTAMRRKELTEEYERLYSEWNRIYREEPPFIKLKTGRNRLDNNFFDSAKEYSNNIPIERPVEYNGRIFRSKNEQLTAMLLDKLEIPYKYETELVINGKSFHPDFLVNIREADACIYMEIFGLSDDPDYMAGSERKIRVYLKAGLKHGKNLILIFVPNAYTFDTDAVRSMILSAIETLIETKL